MARVLINVQEPQKEQWVKAAHQEMVSLSEWIRRACDVRLGNTLEVVAANTLTDQQIQAAAEGALLLAQVPAAKAAAFPDPIVETAARRPPAAKELPVEDAGTAPVSVPTATPRLTPEQSNLQAAVAENKEFKPDFKPEAKPKKPRR